MTEFNTRQDVLDSIAESGTRCMACGAEHVPVSVYPTNASNNYDGKGGHRIGQLHVQFCTLCMGSYRATAWLWPNQYPDNVNEIMQNQVVFTRRILDELKPGWEGPKDAVLDVHGNVIEIIREEPPND